MTPTPRRTQSRVAADLVRAVLEGPVTEYGVAPLVAFSGGSAVARARRWLRCWEGAGVLQVIDRRRNPSGARKGTHPVYALRKESP